MSEAAGAAFAAWVTSIMATLSEQAAAVSITLAEAIGVAGPAVEAMDFGPQLADAILSSAKVAELLDTPAGKALVASGGVAALHARGILDEAEVTAKSVESSLEGILNQMTSGGGE